MDILPSLGDFVSKRSYNNSWNGLFELEDLVLSKSDVAGLQNYLAKQLADLRFTMPELGNLFIEHALDKGMQESDATMVWTKIQHVVKENIAANRASTNIEQDLRNNLSGCVVSSAHDPVVLANEFRAFCSMLISKNLPDASDPSSLIGSVGELFAFLYGKDIAKYDFIHHKLVPDNARKFRHGMDVLGVKFDAEDERKDTVYFLEAKATVRNFPSQRNDMVSWFNTELEIKANTMVDQAKRTLNLMSASWIDAVRANKALSRFQVKLNDITKSQSSCVGTVVLDDVENTPTDDQIRGFNKVKFPHKQLVIIKVSPLQQLATEVVRVACMT